jgi:hypothetical protein
VIPHKSGWALKKDNAERASLVTDAKREAERIGRAQARREQTELVIHDREGNVECCIKPRH